MPKRHFIGEKETVRTPSGRTVGWRQRKESDEPVMLLGGKGALTHEPKRTLAERLAGPERAKRYFFPNAGESAPRAVGEHDYTEKDTRKTMTGPRTGIRKVKPDLYTSREKIVPDRRPRRRLSIMEFIGGIVPEIRK